MGHLLVSGPADSPWSRQLQATGYEVVCGKLENLLKDIANFSQWILLHDLRFLPALEHCVSLGHTVKEQSCFRTVGNVKGQCLYLRRLSGITPGDSDAGTVSVSVTGVVAVVVSSSELLMKEVVLEADGLVVTGVWACCA